MSADDKNNSAYNHPNQNPDSFIRWSPEHIQEYKEEVYDRISKLFIENFSEIEHYLGSRGIESLQKTYRGGELVTGRNLTEMAVVYESDTDASSNKKNIEDTDIYFMAHGIAEFLEYQNRQTKYVINSQRIYEFYNFR